LRKGFEIVCKVEQVEEAIVESDLIITGEGRYDSTTSQGKVVHQIELLAKKHRKPLIVLCGAKVLPLEEEGQHENVYDFLSLFDLNTSLSQPEYCMEQLIKSKLHHFPVLSQLQ